MSNFRELLEQIREQDSVQVPDIVKFNVEYRKSIQPLLASIENYNRTKDTETLKYSLQQSLRVIAEIFDKEFRKTYDYKLTIKKKQYVIDKLKQFIDDKPELDAELPDDEIDAPGTANKKDPLEPSAKELARIKKFIN